MNKVTVKKRFCELVNFPSGQCDVGWGAICDGKYQKCMDDPKEENCRYLVDVIEEALREAK